MMNQQTLPPVPRVVKRQPADSKEIIALPLIYALAFVYTFIVTGSLFRPYFGIFTLSFILVTEFVYTKERSRAARLESIFFGACMIVMLLGHYIGRNRVWESMVVFFMHAYALYYVSSRSGRQIEGRSGRFFLLDIVNIVFVFPLKNFILAFHVMKDIYLRHFRTRRQAAVWASIVAIFLSSILFIIAVILISSADNTFERWLVSFFEFILNFQIFTFIMRCFWSVWIAAYLYGLICGTGRESKTQVALQSQQVDSLLDQARLVPGQVWNLILIVFSLFYFIFFIVHGTYLFSAFRNSLPEGFTYSEYARRGFFELCAIMSLNFALLWMSSRFTSESINEASLHRKLKVVLLVESLLFSCIAFSKLILYIDAYGFTPLRFQSAWLVSVLAFGTILWILSMIRRKSYVRYWIYFSGITLALLHLV